MLNKHDYFDKHLLALHREESRLRKRQWLPVLLEKPIQRGWRRFHALASDAEKRADKDVLHAILAIISVVRLSRTPEFRKKRGRGSRRRFIEVEQPLRALTAGQWEKRRLPEAWKPYFIQEKRYADRAWLDVIVFASPDLFELKIEPNWVAKIWIPDPEVESRLDEINQWLNHRQGKHRLHWLRDRSYWWRASNRAELFDRIAEREVRDAMRDPSEVDLVTFMQSNRITPWRFFISTEESWPGILYFHIACSAENIIVLHPARMLAVSFSLYFPR